MLAHDYGVGWGGREGGMMTLAVILPLVIFLSFQISFLSS